MPHLTAARWNLTADTFWLCVLKEPIENRSFQLPKVITASMAFVSGVIRFSCRRQPNLTRTSTTCDWFDMKTAGSTVCFARSEKIRMLLREICHPLSRNVESQGLMICKSGKDCLT